MKKRIALLQMYIEFEANDNEAESERQSLLDRARRAIRREIES